MIDFFRPGSYGDAPDADHDPEAPATPAPEAPETDDRSPTPDAPAGGAAARAAEGRARRRRVAALEGAIAWLSAHLQAATYRLLVLIRAFDVERGWADQGFRSCARWLSWRTGIGPGAARERVRVARALGELPVLSEAMRRGELSYSLARAVTRIASPENEAELVETARHVSAAEMERLIRAWRRSERSEVAELAEEALRHADRKLTLVAEADGSWRISGRLDPEAGARLARALEAAEEALYRTERNERAEASEGEAGDEADDEPAVPAPARRADALGLVAEAALGEGLGAEAEGAPAGRGGRFEVVVHVDVETLVGSEDEDVSAETPRIEGGPRLVAETARRLACEAGIVPRVRGRWGQTLAVGRRTRSVPPALRRALAVRDGGCRFPGCGSRFCEAHHVLPWAAGGETSLENLVLLCRRHHRLVHEGGWTLERVEGSQGPARFRFLRPGGGRLPEVPDRPAVAGDPVGAIVDEQAGLGIDAWTATPRWDGLAMDVDFALEALRGPDGLKPEPGDGDGAAGGTSARDVPAETPAGDDGEAAAGEGDTGSDTVWRHVSAETPAEDDRQEGGEEDEGGASPD